MYKPIMPRYGRANRLIANAKIDKMAVKSAKTLMLAATHRCSSDKVVLMTFASSLHRITALVFKGDQRAAPLTVLG